MSGFEICVSRTNHVLSLCKPTYIKPLGDNFCVIRKCLLTSCSGASARKELCVLLAGVVVIASSGLLGEALTCGQVPEQR